MTRIPRNVKRVDRTTIAISQILIDWCMIKLDIRRKKYRKMKKDYRRDSIRQFSCVQSALWPKSMRLR